MILVSRFIHKVHSDEGTLWTDALYGSFLYIENILYRFEINIIQEILIILYE